MTISTRPPHIRELARFLGINASSVFRYVRRNGLKIDRAEGCCFLVDEGEVSQLIDYYAKPVEEAVTLSGLAKNLGVNSSTLTRYVHRHELPTRKVKGQFILEDPLALADIQLYYQNDRQRDQAFLDFLQLPQSRWVFFDQSIYMSMEHLSKLLSHHPFDYTRRACDEVRNASGLSPLKGIEREVTHYELKQFKAAWYRKYEEWPFPYSNRLVLGDIIKAFSYYKLFVELPSIPEERPTAKFKELSEAELQALICEFSSYTKKPFSQEQSLVDEITERATRRIDFQRVDDLERTAIFYELKSPRLKLAHVKQKLEEARYLEVIQNNYPDYAVDLVFVAFSAELDALREIQKLPSVRYQSVEDLFGQIEKELITNTPQKAQIYTNCIIHRFKNLLSNRY